MSLLSTKGHRLRATVSAERFPSAQAMSQPKITDRKTLITALHSAAIVEHMLMCSYLFASFSIRRDLSDFPEGTAREGAQLTIERSRAWLSQINLVARQEMEHLGIVMNLLAAVGVEPYFHHPTFPQPASLLATPFTLDRFDKTTMQRFLCYERPAYLCPDFCGDCSGLNASNGATAAVNLAGFATVQELYDEIAAAFQTLPVSEVFRGNTDRQLPQPTFGYAINLASVTNRSDANAAIAQILMEGEGIGENPMSDDSHFQKFVRVYDDLEQALTSPTYLDPAFPVVSNPIVGLSNAPSNPTDQTGAVSSESVSLITDPNSIQAMNFFSDCYQSMLVMLNTFFATYSQGGVPEPRPQAALFYAAFFPLMTMVIRPMGEIIAHMPAGDGFPHQNAGANFDINSP